MKQLVAALATDEATMRLEGHVRVHNGSGEDYAEAQTRLIVRKMNLLDQIAAFVRRDTRYDRPGQVVPPAPGARRQDMKKLRMFAEAEIAPGAAAATPKEVVNEGLSECFLYPIEGTCLRFL